MRCGATPLRLVTLLGFAIGLTACPRSSTSDDAGADVVLADVARPLDVTATNSIRIEVPDGGGVAEIPVTPRRVLQFTPPACTRAPVLSVTFATSPTLHGTLTIQVHSAPPLTPGRYTCGVDLHIRDDAAQCAGAPYCNCIGPCIVDVLTGGGVGAPIELRFATWTDMACDAPRTTWRARLHDVFVRGTIERGTAQSGLSDGAIQACLADAGP